MSEKWYAFIQGGIGPDVWDRVSASAASYVSTAEPIENNTVRTAYEEGIPNASVEIHGDKQCVFGDDGVFDFFNDRFLFGELSLTFSYPFRGPKTP